MNPFIRLWRWLFPRPLIVESDHYLIDNRIAFLRLAIAIRCEKIAEARRKKAKRSHLVEANQRDRTEMLRLERQLWEMSL
jgi:hypothetical protein